MLLYYITDRKGFRGHGTRSNATRCCAGSREAARAGVDYIQLREKDLSPRELEASQVKPCARFATTRPPRSCSSTAALISPWQAAPMAFISPTEKLLRQKFARCGCNAEPVALDWRFRAHSRRRSRRSNARRRLCCASRRSSRKCKRARQESASRLCAPRARKRRRIEFAVLALGGVTLSNARCLYRAGAAGVAGIRLFQQGNVFDTVRRLREAVKTHEHRTTIEVARKPDCWAREARSPGHTCSCAR